MTKGTFYGDLHPKINFNGIQYVSNTAPVSAKGGCRGKINPDTRLLPTVEPSWGEPGVQAAYPDHSNSVPEIAAAGLYLPESLTCVITSSVQTCFEQLTRQYQNRPFKVSRGSF